MFTAFTARLSAAASTALLVAALLPVSAAAQTITKFLPATAAPGATVSITGTNLAATQTVSINGQPMPVLTRSSTLVTVSVPAAASTGKLRLTTTTKATTLSGAALGVTRVSSKLSASLVAQASTSGSGSDQVSAAGAYSTPTACDLDNDGLMELLLGNGNGYIELFSKSSASATTLTSRGLLQAGGVALKVANYAKPCLADLDGDGLPELIVGTGTDKRLMCYEYAPTAANKYAFAAGALLTAKANANASANSASTIVLSDFPRACISDLDGDGRLDMLVGDYNGYLNRFEQAADNSLVFVALGTLKDGSGAAIATGSDTTKPSIVDLDGDGFLDLVIGSHDGSIKLYTQTGAGAVTFKAVGNFSDGKNNVTTTALGGYAAPCITDYDNDGLLDFFIGNGNGTLYRYEQNPSATTPTITAPLPVVLASFGGQALSAGNQLNWATASEANSAYFAVERSQDGATFGEISRQATANSITGHRYQYLDAAAPAGTSYYRLRQVDQDGTTAYSAVVALNRAAAASAARPQAFPTAFTTELSLMLPEATVAQPATVALYAATGQLVYSQALTLSPEPQALPGLPTTLAPGRYVLRITTAAGTSSQPVVRQ